MDRYLVEGLAVRFYEQLGLDPSVPVATGRLARLRLGAGCIKRGVHLVGEDAKLGWMGEQRIIALRKRLAPAYAVHRIAHELAHVIFEEIDHVSDDIEADCDALGAALMAPAPAMRRLRRTFGSDVAAVADAVGGTHTWAGLREAESVGATRIIITPTRVHVRADESVVLPPTERELRSLERGRRPGITKVRIKDQPGRMMIDVDLDSVG